MEKLKKDEILSKAKLWMRENIVIPHVKNTEKLAEDIAKKYPKL